MASMPLSAIPRVRTKSGSVASNSPSALPRQIYVLPHLLILIHRSREHCFILIAADEAPTDAAFAKLPKATVTSLTKPENKEQLKAILLYHVVKGKVTAKDVMAMKSPTSVATLNGAKIKITHTKHSVMVNKSKITTADLMAVNGVIYVIDTVLLPPKK